MTDKLRWICVVWQYIKSWTILNTEILDREQKYSTTDVFKFSWKYLFMGYEGVGVNSGMGNAECGKSATGKLWNIPAGK